jgi:hypothetical protein
MGLRLGPFLLLKIFNFFLEKPDLLCTLHLYGIQLTLHFNPLMDLLFNLPVLGLQLARSIFYNSQFVRFQPRLIGHSLLNQTSMHIHRQQNYSAGQVMGQVEDILWRTCTNL